MEIVLIFQHIVFKTMLYNPIILKRLRNAMTYFGKFIDTFLLLRYTHKVTSKNHRIPGLFQGIRFNFNKERKDEFYRIRYQ